MADALASGASARKGVGVQLPPLAFHFSIFPLHFSSFWCAWVPVFAVGTLWPKPKRPGGKMWFWPQPPTGQVGIGTRLGPGRAGWSVVLVTCGERLRRGPSMLRSPWIAAVF